MVDEPHNGPMDEPMRIAALVLAAGASTRFGSPKQLAPVGDRTMLRSVIDLAREVGLDPIVVVLPPAIGAPPDTVQVVNEHPEEGLSRSLRLGIAAMPPEVDAAVILLGDQPTVAPGTIRLLLDAARPDRPVIAGRANGHLAPPVLLMRDAFGFAMEAKGDEGLRSMLADNPELVTSVEVGSHAPDVDTPADLERLPAPPDG
jgi:molybdenum cofactor cytidylyltransferase